MELALAVLFADRQLDPGHQLDTVLARSLLGLGETVDVVVVRQGKHCDAGLARTLDQVSRT